MLKKLNLKLFLTLKLINIYVTFSIAVRQNKKPRYLFILIYRRVLRRILKVEEEKEEDNKIGMI